MSEEEQNHKPALRKPCNENPWYVMMTIAGEEDSDTERKLHKKNRRHWNAWVAQVFSEEEKYELIFGNRAAKEDLAPLTEEEKEAITNAIKERCPNSEKIGLGQSIDFDNTVFKNIFSCEGFIFPYKISAYKAIFSKGADFSKATFSEGADFQGATFLEKADFNKATFLKWADFRKVIFLKEIWFDKARFSNSVDFREVTFEQKVKFQDAKFESAASFRGAKFLEAPPEFFNVTFSEDADWRYIQWPTPPEKREQSIEFSHAYKRLIFIMVQQKKFQDESFLLRQKLFRSGKTENPKALPTFFSPIYGWAADFVWSIKRPFIALSIIWLIFIGILLIYGIEFLG